MRVSRMAKYNSSLGILRSNDLATIGRRRARGRRGGEDRQDHHVGEVNNPFELEIRIRWIRGRGGGPLENQDVNDARRLCRIRNQSHRMHGHFRIDQRFASIRETIS